MSSTYALLDRLNIFLAHADAPRSAQMPRSLSRQVLDHDTGQDGKLSFDLVEDVVVGEVEAVGDLFARPVCLCLSKQSSPDLKVPSRTEVSLGRQHIIDALHIV
jgi:hypothetical protein